ncbi:amidohydrolase [Nocardioides sp. BGMRC 2183]|nr:amidohydrolase [Nocardioides sp. BGMRC 2183]
MQFTHIAGALQPDLAALRRELHQVPELGLDLPQTRELVVRELKALGLDATHLPRSGGVVAVIRGTKADDDGHRRAVLLRGDMDALSIDENTDLPFSSTNGAMHACGHDLHTAALLGAAQLLNAHADTFAGDVILMFQPGEEGYDGARIMIEEGVLDAAGSPVVGAYALHVFSGRYPLGMVGVRSGPIMSAADRLYVTVHGKGGHGSTPQLAVDPIVIAAEMVTALQAVVTRRFDAFDPVILSVTKIAGGDDIAVIPHEVTFAATVRSFSNEARESLEQLCTRTLNGIAAAHGASVTVDYQKLYPVTVNDATEADRVIRVAAENLPEDDVVVLPNPLNASEDFSRVLAEVPGAFIVVGATPPGVDPADAPFNHSAEAVFDEQSLWRGAALLAGLAVDRLNDPTR